MIVFYLLDARNIDLLHDAPFFFSMGGFFFSFALEYEQSILDAILSPTFLPSAFLLRRSHGICF